MDPVREQEIKSYIDSIVAPNKNLYELINSSPP